MIIIIIIIIIRITIIIRIIRIIITIIIITNNNNTDEGRRLEEQDDADYQININSFVFTHYFSILIKCNTSIKKGNTTTVCYTHTHTHTDLVFVSVCLSFSAISLETNCILWVRRASQAAHVWVRSSSLGVSLCVCMCGGGGCARSYSLFLVWRSHCRMVCLCDTKQLDVLV